MTVRKVGTIISLKSSKLSDELYLGERDVLTPRVGMAKCFHTTAIALAAIKAQVVARYPEFQFVASDLERWTDDTQYELY
jgi:hypothetical protein